MLLIIIYQVVNCSQFLEQLTMSMTLQDDHLAVSLNFLLIVIYISFSSHSILIVPLLIPNKMGLPKRHAGFPASVALRWNLPHLTVIFYLFTLTNNDLIHFFSNSRLKITFSFHLTHKYIMQPFSMNSKKAHSAAILYEQ